MVKLIFSERNVQLSSSIYVHDAISGDGVCVVANVNSNSSFV